MDGRAVDITEQILGAAIAVHRALGPGLLESTYEACLAFELIDRGLPIVRQAALPVVYLGVRIDCGYRLDLVVEGTVIVEIKSVERILPVHEAQILTSLRVLRELCGDHPWPERRLCTSPTGVPMLAHAQRSTADGLIAAFGAGGARRADPNVHRLLQRCARQTVSLDLRRYAAAGGIAALAHVAPAGGPRMLGSAR